MNLCAFYFPTVSRWGPWCLREWWPCASLPWPLPARPCARGPWLQAEQQDRQKLVEHLHWLLPPCRTWEGLEGLSAVLAAPPPCLSYPGWSALYLCHWENLIQVFVNRKLSQPALSSSEMNWSNGLLALMSVICKRYAGHWSRPDTAGRFQSNLKQSWEVVFFLNLSILVSLVPLLATGWLEPGCKQM